jgi:hypothetical protein
MLRHEALSDRDRIFFAGTLARDSKVDIPVLAACLGSQQFINDSRICCGLGYTSYWQACSTHLNSRIKMTGSGTDAASSSSDADRRSRGCSTPRDVGESGSRKLHWMLTRHRLATRAPQSLEEQHHRRGTYSNYDSNDAIRGQWTELWRRRPTPMSSSRVSSCGVCLCGVCALQKRDSGWVP